MRQSLTHNNIVATNTPDDKTKRLQTAQSPKLNKTSMTDNRVYSSQESNNDYQRYTEKFPNGVNSSGYDKSISSSYDMYQMSPIEIAQTSTDVTDFDENEWTPQDSSYGAAIPICGWIPKSTRQLIEKAIMAVALFFICYLVVSLMIQLTSGFTSSGQSSNIHMDDDFYVEMGHDDAEGKVYNTAYYQDDDDLFDKVYYND